MASCCGGNCSRNVQGCCSPDKKNDRKSEKTAENCCGDRNLG